MKQVDDIFFRNEIDLSELIHEASPGDCPYTLFIGAGASESSGIPTVKGMVRTWKERIFKSERKIRFVDVDLSDEYKRWENNEYPQWLSEHLLYSNQSEYSALFMHCYHQPMERQLHIESILEGKKPTFGYLYLASLIAERRFNKILTTNFDDLLNDALVKFYDAKPITCSFDSSINSVRISSLKPKIVQLHGDFFYDDINIISNSSSNYREIQENITDKMLEMTKDCGLIVMGYSGLDESIMRSLERILDAPGHLKYGLHWCIRRGETTLASKKKIPESLRNIVTRYKKLITFYEIESFNHAIEEMHIRCDTSMPKCLTEPEQYNIIFDFQNAVIEGTSRYMSDKMVEYLDLFLDKTNRIERETDDFLVKSAELKWNRGRLYRNNGQFEEALSEFVGGYQLIKSIALDIEKKRPELAIQALRRISGLCIGIAKLTRSGLRVSDNNYLSDSDLDIFNDYNLLLEKCFGFLERGRQLCELNRSSLSKSKTIQRTFPYNYCCALSLFSEWKNQDGTLNVSCEDWISKTRSIIQSCVSEIQYLDTEGNHLPKLLKDRDFAYLKDKFPDIFPG